MATGGGARMDGPRRDWRERAYGLLTGGLGAWAAWACLASARAGDAGLALLWWSAALIAAFLFGVKW